MHDCEVPVGDRWLASVVPAILASPAWRSGGVLFITWDEDDEDTGANLVPLIVVAPELASQRTNVNYDHYSLLATIEDLLGVPRLGEAARRAPIADLLKPRS